MFRFILFPLLTGLVGSSLAQEPKPPNPAANPAAVPVARVGVWERIHAGFLAIEHPEQVRLLFLGDSITAGWESAGVSTWNRHYRPRKAANFGIGGDRTQHLLWRVEHGELDKVKPRLVVLLIGANNVESNTPLEVAEGVKSILDRIRSRLPEAKVLLLGVLPQGASRDPTPPSAPPDPRVPAINLELARLADGKSVRFLDVGPKLLDKTGQVPRATFPDFVHLSRTGYQAWADAMEPTLWELLEGADGKR
jgi:lysophospholipase L1-like esterase